MAFMAQFDLFDALGIVSVESLSETTYEEIQASMGTFYYGLKAFYIKTNSSEQLLSAINFYNYDANGNVKAYTENPVINPYQFQISAFVKPTFDGIIFNGDTTMNMDLLPNEIVFLVLHVCETSNGTFQGQETIINEFFNDYIEEL
jgi:hypothetical protein